MIKLLKTMYFIFRVQLESLGHWGQKERRARMHISRTSLDPPDSGKTLIKKFPILQRFP